jgi:hypothetical protein
MSASSSLPSDFVGWNLMVDSVKSVVLLLRTSHARKKIGWNFLENVEEAIQLAWIPIVKISLILLLN